MGRFKKSYSPPDPVLLSVITGRIGHHVKIYDTKTGVTGESRESNRQDAERGAELDLAVKSAKKGR